VGCVPSGMTCLASDALMSWRTSSVTTLASTTCATLSSCSVILLTVLAFGVECAPSGRQQVRVGPIWGTPQSRAGLYPEGRGLQA
jgi:hypothetical protein